MTDRKHGIAYLITAEVLSWVAGLGFVAFHFYTAYIAWHAGIGWAILTFILPVLAEIFWAGVISQTAHTFLNNYVCMFVALMVCYGLFRLMERKLADSN